VGAAVVIEGDVKLGKIAKMLVPHVRDQGFFAPLLLLSADHDGCAVRVVGTEVNAAAAPESLEPHPYVSLDVFDQMAQVNRAIRVRKGCSDKDFRVAHCGGLARGGQLGAGLF
jgi:hypothetical protein